MCKLLRIFYDVTFNMLPQFIVQEAEKEQVMPDKESHDPVDRVLDAHNKPWDPIFQPSPTIPQENGANRHDPNDIFSFDSAAASSHEC